MTVSEQKDNKTTAAPVPPRQRKSSAPNAKPAAPTDSNKRAPSRSKEKLTPRATPLVSPASEQPPAPITAKDELVAPEDEHQEKQDEMKPEVVTPSEPTPVLIPKILEPTPAVAITEQQQPEAEQTQVETLVQPTEELPECDMTASMLAKQRINTEEQARAALAERRRLAREQAEREAELERQRQEELERQEEERAKREEEEMRRMEVETLHLLEEARRSEEERLKAAIEEAKRREEEEYLAREEEARQRAEKEEQEKKAREEAEKQRKEMAERLKKEEEERQARRKRVEAIMSRTRKTGTPTGTQKDGDEDGGKVSPSEEMDQQTQQQQQNDSMEFPAPSNGPSQHTNGHHPLIDVSNDLIIGEDQEDGTPGHPGSRARKKTDLTPTIPTTRDSSRSRHRSPGTGKSQSMSHLNLLSTSPRPPPRKSPQTLLVPSLGSRAALSRSTGTLHKASPKGEASTQPQQLRKTRATQSMSQLAQGRQTAPVAPPRMTRAERLRQKARQIALANKEKAENGTHRSSATDTTPSVSSSRPQSAMSQQSDSRPTPAQMVQMRPRPPARKPRPSSIAVTGVGVSSDAVKLSKTPVSEQKDNKTTAAPVPPRQRKSSAPNAKPAAPTDSNKRAPSRSKEKLTPRATPLVSPASEQPPAPITAKDELVAPEDEHQEKQDEMKPEVVTPSEPTPVLIPKILEPTPAVAITEQQQPEAEQTQVETLVQPTEELPECDMTASMLAKQRINTEEQARAALAERRRLAREQAEREAELERQRQGGPELRQNVDLQS
ncbi:hypothetical protein B566_EDAN014715 [Ephemera danica]|nr:hypothetical protein B566_EDAN014715 [Ephemera danica]